MPARIALLLAVLALMTAQALASGGRTGLRLAVLWLRRAIGVAVALVVLFAEWGWRPLAALLGQLRRLALFARLESWLQTLPPYGALAAFVLPSLFLVPLKVLAIYFIAHGQKLTALGLLAAAKLGGTALVARLYILTGPQLMRIPWFARAYHVVMPWKEAVYAQIRASWAWRYGRMVKGKVKQSTRRAWMRWRPWLAERVALVRYQLRAWLRRA